MKWLQQIFELETQFDYDGWWYLILDDHSSHYITEVINFTLQHQIIMLCLFTYAIHLLKLLNVNVFCHLINDYVKNFACYIEFSKIYNINKTDFLNLFQNAHKNSIKTNHIQSIWVSTGFVFYDSELVLNKLSKEEQSITSPKQAISVVFFENGQLNCLR